MYLNDFAKEAGYYFVGCVGRGQYIPFKTKEEYKDFCLGVGVLPMPKAYTYDEVMEMIREETNE